jgi:glycerol uptake operon antiterminator
LGTKLLDYFEAYPIIAAVRDEHDLAVALSSSAKIIFLLDATLCNLKERVEKIKARQKKAFIHLDMVSGLSKDPTAVEFIKSEINPAGIITTKTNLIQYTKQIGLSTIQRLFILDSLSIQTGLKMIQANQPDFIEVMPGIIPKVIPEIKSFCQIPIIAGGMISTKGEIIELLKAGVLAISTSNKNLWEL